MATYEPLRPCRNGAGFEAEPQGTVDLDLAQAGDRLEAAGLPVVADAGMLLVVEAAGVEVSLFDHGKLLVKSRDRSVAEAAADAVRTALDL